MLVAIIIIIIAIIMITTKANATSPLGRIN